MTAYTVTIEIDDEPLHPRRDCEGNVGLFYTFNGLKYDVGDSSLSPDDMLAVVDLYKRGGIPYLPVYMIDHSSQSFSTVRRGDKWDESHIGYIFLNTRAFLDSIGGKIMSRKRNKLAYEYLKGEIQAIDDYHNTTYYYATIEDDEYYVIDSCSGFESEADARQWAGDVLGAMDT